MRLFENGLGRLTHFLTWLVQYTILNIIISLLYALHINKWVFAEDSFGCIFLTSFLALESLFAFVWALRPLSNTPRMAMIVTGFCSFLSFALSYASDQKEGVLDLSTRKSYALSPFTAIKNTLDTYAIFHAMSYPMNFESWETKRFNWSLKIGADQMIVNFLVWLAIALAIELGISGYRYYRRT